MSLYYAVTNLVTEDTLDSVSSEDTTFVKEFLYNQRQSKPFRFTAKSDNWIKVDLGSATQVTIAAILNHNVLSSGTITLRAHATDLGTLATWQSSASYSTTITIKSPSCYEAINQTYRWWHIEFDNASGENVEIGEYFLGTYSTFTMGYKYPFREKELRTVTENLSVHGQRWRYKIAEKAYFGVDFDAVTDANLISEIKAFFAEHENDTPFVFVPESTEGYCYYVFCLNDLEAARNFEDLNAFSLELEEQTRGVSIV